MNLRRNADHEFAAEATAMKWFRRGFVTGFKVLKDPGYQASDAAKRRLRRAGYPTEAGEFSTESYMFIVFLGPDDSIGITVANGLVFHIAPAR